MIRLVATFEAFKVATSSLRSNKLRTALTLIGIIVGVTAVIAVVTIIKGLDQTVAQTFSSQGSTVFTVSKNPLIIKSREEFVKFNRRKDVTHEDAEAIARLCTSCWRVGIAANAIETVKYGDQKAENVQIRGVDPITMFDIDGVSIDVGRIWTESEGTSGREICVVGPDMLKNLFGDAPADRAVGQAVRIDGRPYLVLGVLEPRGSVFGFSRDNVIYIPYSTYQKAYGGR
ncbi:MAG TPA: ABC transporter permease, partial [Pyrinomonadaceae bacterium]|nr:ABC transporter permease [Pyrinomonadaceae bacterium]